jgi:CheY-like chemotaxis protein
MSEEVKARAFEPFFTTKGIGEGPGLGLATSYGIIKQSGGFIGVESEPGQGTTLTIYLPAVEPPAMVPVPRLDSPEMPSGAETILLVEPDPALREMAATLLRRLGYTVLAAADGRDALRLASEGDSIPIDLLFSDVTLPDMSGEELAGRIHASSPRTRILFSSAYTDVVPENRDRSGRNAMYLQKPFTPSALARKLRDVFEPPVASTPAAA